MAAEEREVSAGAGSAEDGCSPKRLEERAPGRAPFFFELSSKESLLQLRTRWHEA
ncbi:hypothetical protein PM3016_5844 [Paenibacillus mucilaginosus 3016]|uniref:Uncharacterized protein n=3 Tax=Paenibacillus mucilaginosus TaxID=61624 RepID=H6NND7_9BACL|nr:hypothetical protein KNP414_06227 [Paenibacillus mucilaginosus KNP414]AFC32516.1 hypothetical protein PM3016_5844 [Paenibacillus mucilaginosus 3016]AFH64834.1 hypothetical protein B2K_29740 [Paenibacillus mucilaginosus K02]